VTDRVSPPARAYAASAGVKRRWSLVVIGVWVMGSICMSVVATENFYTVDRLLAAPGQPAFAGMVQTLGQPAARELLRYLSSELNRLYFQMWDGAQIVLGVAALWLLAGSRKQDAAACNWSSPCWRLSC
jgi:hypothetical protein